MSIQKITIIDSDPEWNKPLAEYYIADASHVYISKCMKELQQKLIDLAENTEGDNWFDVAEEYIHTHFNVLTINHEYSIVW